MKGKYRIPFYMSTDCENLLKKFLVINPSKRTTLEVSSKYVPTTASIMCAQYLGHMITNDAKCHVEIKRRTAMGEMPSVKEKELMREKI